MTLRLHQLLTIEKSAKAQALAVLTAFYHRIEKVALLAGISKRYRSLAEEGERLSPESTLVQLRVEESFPEISGALGKLFDLILAKEDGNQKATADIVVDGKVLLTGIPVCALLFLEKQLVDLSTFVGKLPTLDPSEKWERDASQNCWATQPIETHRGKKVARVMEKAPATKEHPAQVEVVYEDQVVGYWSTTKFSGALPADRKAVLADRVIKLAEAVKIAREEANAKPVGDRKMGDVLLGYLFAK